MREILVAVGGILVAVGMCAVVIGFAMLPEFIIGTIAAWLGWVV